MDKYRSMDAWKRAHAVALSVIRCVDHPRHPRSRSVFEQLKRAAVSVEANIVEGYALSTPAQFKRHLRIALGSAAEAECLVRMSAEVEYLTEAEARDLEGALGLAMSAIVGLLRRQLAFRAPG